MFQPYKHFHLEAVDAATRSGCSEFNKIEFLNAIDSIRSLTFKPTTIFSAFKETGIISFDPSIVLEKHFDHELNEQGTVTHTRIAHLY